MKNMIKILLSVVFAFNVDNELSFLSYLLATAVSSDPVSLRLCDICFNAFLYSSAPVNFIDPPKLAIFHRPFYVPRGTLSFLGTVRVIIVLISVSSVSQWIFTPPSRMVSTA